MHPTAACGGFLSTTAAAVGLAAAAESVSGRIERVSGRVEGGVGWVEGVPGGGGCVCFPGVVDVGPGSPVHWEPFVA